MKKYLVAILMVLAALPSIAQFEGTLVMTLESPKLKVPMEIDLTLKGQLTCMQIPSMAEAGFVKSIVYNETQTMLICMDRGGRKVAMKSNLKDNERFMPESTNSKPATFTETKETKEIGGYKCTKVIMETDESIGDLWITYDVKLNMQELLGAMGANKSPGSVLLRNFKRYYAERKGVSMLSLITNKKNNEQYSIAISDIKESKVDEKIFNVDDFQLMDAPTMGGGAVTK